MTTFAKMIAMEECTVVVAKDGIGVKIEHAKKFPGLERYLLCDCKATTYNDHYVVQGSEEFLYRVISKMAAEYVPAFLVC